MNKASTGVAVDQKHTLQILIRFGNGRRRGGSHRNIMAKWPHEVKKPEEIPVWPRIAQHSAADMARWRRHHPPPQRDPPGSLQGGQREHTSRAQVGQTKLGISPSTNRAQVGVRRKACDQFSPRSHTNQGPNAEHGNRISRRAR
ncbi:hypothetical protein U1Q18_008950 [Sarracenia purpurea var. burkii]